MSHCPTPASLDQHLSHWHVQTCNYSKTWNFVTVLTLPSTSSFKSLPLFNFSILASCNFWPFHSCLSTFYILLCPKNQENLENITNNYVVMSHLRNLDAATPRPRLELKKAALGANEKLSDMCQARGWFIFHPRLYFKKVDLVVNPVSLSGLTVAEAGYSEVPEVGKTYVAKLCLMQRVYNSPIASSGNCLIKHGATIQVVMIQMFLRFFVCMRELSNKLMMKQLWAYIYIIIYLRKWNEMYNNIDCISGAHIGLRMHASSNDPHVFGASTCLDALFFPVSRAGLGLDVLRPQSALHSSECSWVSAKNDQTC